MKTSIIIRNKIALLIFLLIFSSWATAQKESVNIKRGNKNYKKAEYTEAEIDYRRGLDKNVHSFEANYNLGNALFKQNKYPEAGEAYLKATTLLDTKDPKITDAQRGQMAAAFHNLGNACFAIQQYLPALEAYKQSLRLNPKDDNTRYNLVKTLEMLKQQENQPQQEQQQQQEQKEQQQQEQEQQEQEQKEQEMQQAKQDENQMDKETAEQILQALEQDEEKTQEKLQKTLGGQKRVEKNW